MSYLEFVKELKLRALFAAIMFTWKPGVLLKVKAPYMRKEAKNYTANSKFSRKQIFSMRFSK